MDELDSNNQTGILEDLNFQTRGDNRILHKLTSTIVNDIPYNVIIHMARASTKD